MGDPLIKHIQMEGAARRTLKAEFGKGKYDLRAFRKGSDGRFNFDLEHLGTGGVTFDEMSAVARLFDTTGINVSAVYFEGCPTCGGTTEYTLEVIGAKVTR